MNCWAVNFSPNFLLYRIKLLSDNKFFGIGWDLSGVCRGPVIATLGTGNTGILRALGSIVPGARVQGLAFRR